MDLKDQCNALDLMFRDRTQVYDKELAHLMDTTAAVTKTQEHVEYFLNKVLPIKTFAATSSMLYATVGQNDKGML
jgi:hypothetical protein